MPATKIMVIRHAEKPEGDGGNRGFGEDGSPDPESLTARGWQRSGALAVLLAPARGPFQDGRLARPGAVFASLKANGGGSRRPSQTVTPLARRLGLAITTFPKDRIDHVVAAARDVEGVALIAWQHEAIPEIANAILRDTSAPQSWPGSRFDLVWVFDLDPASGAYRLSQVPQRLLPGDSEETL